MSGSHAYGGDSPGLAGFYHYGGGGLGILGALVAVDGFYGANIDHPADDADEFYALIPSIPAGLTLDTGEAGDFDAAGADGTYTVPFDLYRTGAFYGSTSFALNYGTGAVRNLVISNLASAGTLSTAAVGVTAPAAPGVRNLVIANLASAATLSAAAVAVGAQGAATYNHIDFELETRDGVPLALLADLRWALFSQATPDLFGAPVARGALGSTDGSARGSISVAATSVPVGRYWLVLTNSDGTVDQTPPALTVCCPVMVL